jgi:hypothetical protein
MNILTKEIIAKYYGCKWIMNFSGEEPILMPIIGESITCLERYPRVSENDKLVLKSLDDINEEDIIQVHNLLYGEKDRDKLTYMFQMKNIGEFVSKLQHTNMTGLQNIKIIDFLRSKGYDLDNLIAEGIAVTGL